ncbi:MULTISPECIES: diadenylate cyclase CdaA [Reichenbachiella]|uniref:Diadenylate cyclase n=1 Tax=Reichenbachiella agariperforans TaxID=156994 RepID=A0A1M6LHD2_REIAG|nr:MULTISPECIES: diadenylate cyclase CdaA [Reichenbachiella]MBU2913924.1 diadenylate cyclase CdaA [Reichenbachiella agariperforans]RJE74164.1 TIGR00159 family protein [Reichenbachiella sp. MSK19-1]SHJ70621.1 TIGR00159 family protein [Reichenbachiella agariperforans]
MILGFHIGFLEVEWVDIIDIFFVTILLYQVYKLMRGSVAIKIFLGFLFLYLIYLVVQAANMELVSLILGQFMGVGVIAVIILFQQEIRKFLLLIGRTTIFEEGNLFKNVKQFWRHKFDESHITFLTPLIDAIKTMSGTNTGALIVFSKSSELKFFADSGDRMDAIVSKRLLLAVFNKHSPLHDGAAIINNNKLVAARCILPVSERDDIPANFGLRHRAAIGMSESTDSLVVIVSEETGQLTTARNGEYEHNLSTKEVRSRIYDYLMSEKKNKNKEGSDTLKKPIKESDTISKLSTKADA